MAIPSLPHSPPFASSQARSKPRPRPHPYPPPYPHPTPRPYPPPHHLPHGLVLFSLFSPVLRPLELLLTFHPTFILGKYFFNLLGLLNPCLLPIFYTLIIARLSQHYLTVTIAYTECIILTQFYPEFLYLYQALKE